MKKHLEVTPRTIAKQFGVTTSTARNWCKKYGIGLKVGGRWRIDKTKLSKIVSSEAANYNK